MNLSIGINQFTKIDSLNCSKLQIVFESSLNQLKNHLIPIVMNLQDKQMTKCILLPSHKSIPQPKYQQVVLGGTFDYFHIGHQLLLLTAIFLCSKKILIGITGQSMLQKKKNKQLIQSYQIRKKQIQNYIKLIKPKLQIQIKQLSDPYGPAIFRSELEAIIVSEQTKIGGQKINEIRKQKNLKQLIIQICPLMSQNLKIQSKISSSQIRQYILDKNRMSIQNFRYYKKKWQELNSLLCKYLQIQLPNIYCDEWFNKILFKYSEYWRHYHINRHIFQMLTQFDSLPQKQKLDEIQLLVVLIGIWFHDIQYVPIVKNNQQMSAKIAINFLSGFENQQKQRLNKLMQLVDQAIMDTKIHKTGKFFIQILVDLDMSILDSSPEKYQQYAKMIKLEYLPVVKNEYNKKRAQFLKSLNIKEVFYYKKAKNIQNNIKWELQKLQLNNQIMQ